MTLNNADSPSTSSSRSTTEDQVVAEFHRRLMGRADGRCAGSTTSASTTSTTAPWTTPGRAAKLAADDRDITVLELSRNFGHQAASPRGSTEREATPSFTLDGDGQHSPEPIVDMVHLYEGRYEVVLTAVRRDQRAQASVPRRLYGS